jgi:hypothetical protein
MLVIIHHTWKFCYLALSSVMLASLPFIPVISGLPHPAQRESAQSPMLSDG